MRATLHLTGLLFLLVITGCATKTEREGIDVIKASVANTELGVAYIGKGDYATAMVKLKKALKFDDENANAHHYIAEIYRRLKENKLANEHFKNAIDLNDKDSSVKNNYGIFLCGIASYEKGLILFNKVLADPLYANKGQVYENMGLCSEKQGDILKAENFYKIALKFNKKSPSSLLGLAQIEFDKKNINVANALLNRYKKISRQTSQSLWLEILIARKKGYIGRAGSLALKLKQYYPDSRETNLLRKLNIR